MERSIEYLNTMFSELQKSQLITFDEVKEKKKIMGVYIIYSQENEVLYIGSTNNFYVRFGTDLKHESTHTLMRKLINAAVHENRSTAAYYFTQHYKYRIYECTTKRQAEALEHFSIWMLNPRWNHNYLPLD